MCGRFVSASPPDELARYFDVDQVAETAPRPLLQRGADQRRLRRGRDRRRPPARHLPLGPDPVLGQGRQGRPEDDQRPGRDPRREERLQAALRSGGAASSRPTGSSSGRRSPARRPSSRCTSTAPTTSRWPSPGCGSCGGPRATTASTPTTSPPGSGPARSSPAQPNETMAPDPRPDAGDPAAVGVGRRGSTPTTTTSTPSASCSCRRRRHLITAHPVTHPGQQRARSKDSALIEPFDPDAT